MFWFHIWMCAGGWVWYFSYDTEVYREKEAAIFCSAWWWWASARHPLRALQWCIGVWSCVKGAVAACCLLVPHFASVYFPAHLKKKLPIFFSLISPEKFLLKFLTEADLLVVVVVYAIGVCNWVHIDQFYTPEHTYKDGKCHLNLLLAHLQAVGG